MANGTLIYPMNPLMYVKRGAFRSELFRTSHFRRQLFGEEYYPGEKKEKWASPIQSIDLVSTQFHTTGTPVFTVRRCGTNELVNTLAQTASNAYGGNVYNGTQLTTKLYKYIPSALNIPDGRYYHEILINYPDNTSELLISAAFEIKDVWENTLLMQYRDSLNRYGTFFSQNPQFSKRFFGKLEYTGDRFTESSFDDQGIENKRLSSDRIRVHTLEIGPLAGSQWGMPKYEIDILSEATRCDTLFIDGHQYSKPANESIEQGPVPGNPLIRGTLELLERDVDKLSSFPNYDLGLFTLPVVSNEYPVAGTGVTLNGQTSSFSISGPFEVLALVDVPAFIADLNAQLTTTNLTGTFVFNSTTGLVTYAGTEADGPLNAFPSTTILFQNLEAEEENSGASDLLTFNYKTVASIGTFGGVIVSWGDDSLSVLNSSFVAEGTATHLYTGGAGTRTMRIYHNDNLTVLRFFNDFNEASVNLINNRLPSSLERFELTGGLYGNASGFNLNHLAPCEANLVEFQIHGCGLQGFNGNPWGLGLFSDLKIISIRNNLLTTLKVEGFIDGYYGCLTWSGPGLITTQGQSPPAPITNPLTQARILNMVNAGKSIVTD